jgi:hypothetical protein
MTTFFGVFLFGSLFVVAGSDEQEFNDGEQIRPFKIVAEQIQLTVVVNFES